MAKKMLWGTALLIAGPGVLFSSSRISLGFGTIDIQLEWWGGLMVGRGGGVKVGGGMLIIPRRENGFGTMTSGCVKSPFCLAFPPVVCPFVHSGGRASVPTQHGVRGALMTTVYCRLWTPSFRCGFTLLIWQADSLCQWLILFWCVCVSGESMSRDWLREELRPLTSHHTSGKTKQGKACQSDHHTGDPALLESISLLPHAAPVCQEWWPCALTVSGGLWI